MREKRYTFERSNQLQERLHQTVPGGAHTYARGSDQLPEDMAPILTRGRGARVVDVDGNEFIEYGMGLRAVTLGHGYQPVVDAACAAIADGMNFSRPTAIEVRAAETFLDLVDSADMVKFAKNGSDVTTAAIRLARAVTGRDLVAVCDHPFFSVDDWFIGGTSMDAGIPSDVKSKNRRFSYNDLDSLRRVFDGHPGQMAAVIMEVETSTHTPEPGFLEGVRELCSSEGALLVFDEIITGFRWSKHGAHSLRGVEPDLSCWGKAMGNGFPISALGGKRQYMEAGGLATERDRVFLLSTTHGPETGSLAAFLAVVEAYRTESPIERMEARGRRLADEVNAAALEFGVGDHLEVIGRPSCLVFVTRDADHAPSQEYRTLFLQEILARGVLGQSFVTSAAHTDADITQTIEAVRAALPVYREAIEAGSVTGHLQGRAVAPSIRRRAAPRMRSAEQVEQ